MANAYHSFEFLNVSVKKETLDDLANTNTSDSILSRVQAFLPQLKNANEQLENKNLSELNIENVDNEDGQYIEMNLGLGVYEEKKSRESDTDNEDESSNVEGLMIPKKKPVDKSKKPLIEVLDN
ncbi:hypothetical protein [Parasitella parasitica]|uniref:Uncharacterized protein n=1 Tax=Parasitella parasitica TaxID=35722 RepID=A0A0B7NLZ5_9FUNG|nr:hypothetical protein [Parasitella parasitica]